MSGKSESLSNQLEILDSFQNLLNNIITNLVQLNHEYKVVLEEMESSGMFNDMIENFESKHYELFKDEMEKIIGHISSQDEEYAKKLKNQILSFISNLK